MSRRLNVRVLARWLMLGALVTAVVALVPLVASAEDGDGGDRGDRPRGEPLMLGFALHATGPTTTAARSWRPEPSRRPARRRWRGSRSCPSAAMTAGPSAARSASRRRRGRSSRGSAAAAHAISTDHQWGRGRFRIVDATGDDAGLRGGGRCTLVVDRTTNQLIGTEHGRTRSRP